MVLIPKGDREFWGIGIVKVLWKVLSGVVNRQIRAVVNFHGVLHGFWEGLRTGTSSLKANPLHQMTSMMENVLYRVFFNLRKAYDTLDRERLPDILVGYGIVPLTERVLRLYWENLFIVAQVGRYYVTPL